MSKPLYRISLLLLTLTGCGLLMGKSNINYIEKVTHVSLPDDIKIISQFDNMEWIMVGKYQLPQKEIEGFVAKNPFEHIRPFFSILSHYNAFDTLHGVPLTDTAHLRYFTGCSPGNSWLFIVNPSTGELWIEVQYPDWGGMSPGCDSIPGVDTSKYVIFPYHSAGWYSLFSDSANNVTPATLTPLEVDSMEQYLIGAVEEYNKKSKPDWQIEELSKYRRQYVGYYNTKGEKEAWINFFCAGSNHDWKEQVILVQDGGSCFFNLKINLATHKVYEIAVNAGG